MTLKEREVYFNLIWLVTTALILALLKAGGM